MSAVLLADLGRTVSVEELRGMIAEFDVGAGLTVFSRLTAIELRGDLPEEMKQFANTFDLPLLIKAFVLWGSLEGGRELATADLPRLFRSVNSLPWYSRLLAEVDLDEAVVSLLVRQAHVRAVTDDPLDARIARTWMMFHSLVTDGPLPVADPAAEFLQTFGVSPEDFWVVGFMLWTHQVVSTSQPPYPIGFQPTGFVQEGPRQEEMSDLVGRVVERVSLTPEQFRTRYEADESKYRSPTGREGHWISEFNILRDFPVVQLPGLYCSPFSTYALTRVLDGFYYDLLNEFAERKRVAGGGGNLFDNVMSTTLGALFERYCGRQLRCLNPGPDELLPEFEYGPRRQRRLSPDWILWRESELPVFVECKAREATLDTQRYGDLERLRLEAQTAIGKACGQLARFIQAIENEASGLERFRGQNRFICVVVLLSPYPFHMIPTMRQIIETAASEREAMWPTLRDRIDFVPMSVRELETLVAAEVYLGVKLESVLLEYASYRESAPNVERWEQGIPVFPRHLEEHIQETYNQGRRLSSPLCSALWDGFSHYCEQRIFGDDLTSIENDTEDVITQRLAFEFWCARRRHLWDAERDWFRAKDVIRGGQ